MTRTQSLTIETSKIRQRLNELSTIENLSLEQRNEIDALSSKHIDLESKLRAAIVAETAPVVGEVNPSSETRELKELYDRSSVGNIFDAVVEHRSTDGATAELQGELNLQANQIPIDMLLETRAVTPAPSNVGRNMEPVIPGVFPDSVHMAIGIPTPRVPAGDAVFPVITTNATVGGPHTDSSSVSETTGSFSADVLQPGRLQASFFYRRTDQARFGVLDMALRRNLSDALSDAMDKDILSGTNGLFTGNNLASVAASTATDFADYRERLVFGRVDGTWASTAKDVRVVVGADTYKHMSVQYRASSTDQSALDSIMMDSSGIRVSAHVPAVSSNKQFALVRRGMRRDAVAPMWEGITLIPDEITKAATGEIVITAVMLYAMKILRAAGFAKVETQHA